MSTPRQRMAVIFGGASPEHAVSVRSARAVLAAIDRERFEPMPIGVTRQGAWLRSVETENVLTMIDRGAPICISGIEGEGVLARPPALEALAGADVVFPLIHGPQGEDGTLQGLLELAGLAYVGAGVAASAIAMDKALTKALAVQVGIDVPPFRTVPSRVWRDDPISVARAAAELPLPWFVKPANGGSSLGTTKVHNREALDVAMEDAFRHDSKALIEQGIDGREVECAVLGNHDSATGVEASPVGEIRYTREFYDYPAKYEATDTELLVPAPIDRAVADHVRTIARDSYLAIGCDGMARVDFFLDRQERIWLSEINTIPGFTDMSMFPRMWDAAELPFPQLITRLVDLAMDRHEQRTRHDA